MKLVDMYYCVVLKIDFINQEALNGVPFSLAGKEAF